MTKSNPFRRLDFILLASAFETAGLFIAYSARVRGETSLLEVIAASIIMLVPINLFEIVRTVMDLEKL